MYENFRKEGFSEKLNRNLLQKQCSRLTKNSLILVDPSDMIKPESKQMEGLSRVRDGNTGKRDNDFDLLNMIAFHKEDKGYQISPLCSKLYSKEIEIDIKAKITFNRINDITVFSHNKRVIEKPEYNYVDCYKFPVCNEKEHTEISGCFSITST